MKKEPRYIVLKVKDLPGLSGVQTEQLKDICRTINNYREMRGKVPMDCVVIENDWPEYDQVWEMLAKRVDNA